MSRLYCKKVTFILPDADIVVLGLDHLRCCRLVVEGPESASGPGEVLQAIRRSPKYKQVISLLEESPSLKEHLDWLLKTEIISLSG